MLMRLLESAVSNCNSVESPSGSAGKLVVQRDFPALISESEAHAQDLLRHAS